MFGKLIFKNVSLGKGAAIEQGIIIGLPPGGKKNGELKTVIGKNAFIRAFTIIYAGTEIGDNFQTGPHVLIREGNKIGDNVCIWANSILNPGNLIGHECRIHINCFLEDVKLGKAVFVAPHVVFANDPHPTNPPRREHLQGAVVGDNAIIGANVTILPHINIGVGALIGAGSTVTKDIPKFKVVVGNPARIIKERNEIICNRGGKIHYPYRGLEP